MGMDKYSGGVARTIAVRLAGKYGPQVEAVGRSFGIPSWWFIGLTGMENPNAFEWPDKRSTRFEQGVYNKLKGVQSRWRFWERGYNGVTQAMLQGLSDDGLRNLATSWGQTQIMGYYILTVLRGVTLAQLRDPKQHYFHAAKFMLADPRMARYIDRAIAVEQSGGVDREAFNHVGHIWNSGKDWNGKPGWAAGGKGNIKTYSPNYMYNISLVGLEYSKMPIPAAPETAGQPRPFSEERKVTNALVEETVKVNSILSDADAGQEILGQNEPITLESLATAEPVPIPDIKPGIKTSEGQFTGLFTVAALVASFLGWRSVTPDKLGNIYETIYGILASVGPLVAAGGVLWNYTTSRGKTKSNAINATAAMNMAQFAGLGGLISGKDWKDPKRYIDLAKMAGGILGGPTGSIIGAVTGGADDSRAAREVTDEQLVDAIRTVNKDLQETKGRVTTLQSRFDALHSQLRAQGEFKQAVEESGGNSILDVG